MARRTLPLALLLLVMTVAVVGLGSRVAQGATDLVAAGTSTTLHGGTAASDATLASVEATTTTTVADENDDGVKRVVIVGDSLVVMAEDQLTATFTANGVEVTYIAVSGTGILTDQGERLTQLQEALEALHPDAVIIESCCNYDGTYTLADGTVVPTDSELLWDVWAAQAQLMVSVAQAHDADVYVVVTPRALESLVQRPRGPHRALQRGLPLAGRPGDRLGRTGPSTRRRAPRRGLASLSADTDRAAPHRRRATTSWSDLGRPLHEPLAVAAGSVSAGDTRVVAQEGGSVLDRSPCDPWTASFDKRHPPEGPPAAAPRPGVRERCRSARCAASTSSAGDLAR